MNDHFYNKYKHKIVNEKFLISLRKKKRKKTLIMCHGVFDVVHPGHVRHLVYAKSKADFLVVSLTADKFALAPASVSSLKPPFHMSPNSPPSGPWHL